MDIEDEGYNDEQLPFQPLPGTQPSSLSNLEATVSPRNSQVVDVSHLDRAQRGALAMELLSALDFEQLSELHRRVVPMLKLDIIGALPTELALLVFSYLPVSSLLQASLVARRWYTLSDAQILWKYLCLERHWFWKHSPAREHIDWSSKMASTAGPQSHSRVDEGFNDGELDTPIADVFPPSTSYSTRISPFEALDRRAIRHSTPVLSATSSSSTSPTRPLRPDYKLLFKTRTILDFRLRTGQHVLTVVNTPNIRASLPANFALNHNFDDPNLNAQSEHIFGHTSTIYAICLANDVVTGEPTLFTASRDQTILQWRISRQDPGDAMNTDADPPAYGYGVRGSRRTSSQPMRVFQGEHSASILSVCVAQSYGFLVSGGSDGRTVVWDMRTAQPVAVLAGPEAHEDSVLCVRCDERRLVSCSKDTTVRTFTLPSLRPHLVLRAHRAAVNALALSHNLIASASGDRSLRIWDANTGDLLHVYEGHHGRGLASIDFCFPNIVTGSSDRQIRYFDLSTSRGWTTEAGALSRRRATPEQNPHHNTDPDDAPWPSLPQTQTHLRTTTRQLGRQRQLMARLVFPAAPWTAPHTPARYTSAALGRWDELMRFASSASAPGLSAMDERGAYGFGYGYGYSNALHHHHHHHLHHTTCSCGAALSAQSPAPGLGNTPIEELCPTCGGMGHLHTTNASSLSPANALPPNTPALEQGFNELNLNGTGVGAGAGPGAARGVRGHGDLVRAVAMNDDVVVSGSYDATIKVWDRRTGAFLADFAHGHTGRIFGIALDCTKLVSCGEDERICIWDFAWDMDTSFLEI